MAFSTAQLVNMYSNVHAGLQPSAAVTAQLTELAQLSRTGQLTDAQLSYYLANTGDADLAVAMTAYQFFTGKTPTQAGVAFLVNSTGNPTDLNDAYYQSFSLENRYINFAQNLGLIGEGAARFQQTYGGLTFAQTVQAAYETIIGSAYATAAGYNATAAIADISSRQGYFQLVANERFGGQNQDLAVKAAVVGYIMAEAIKADVGLYAAGYNNFVFDLAPDNFAQYNNDLVANYALQTAGISPPGHVLVLTAGFDAPGAIPPAINTQGQAGDDVFIATNATLTNDSLNGGAGNDRLIFTNLAGSFSINPSLVGIEQIEISSASAGGVTLDMNNAVGVTSVVAVGGATGTGPNDVAVANAITLSNAPNGLAVTTDVDDTPATGSLSVTLRNDTGADTLAVVLRNTDTGGAATKNGLNSLTATGVETLTISGQRGAIANTTVDGSDSVTIASLNATSLTKLVLTGDVALVVGSTLLGASNLATIDASGATKSVTIGTTGTILGGAAAGIDVTTGVGDDFIALSVGSTATPALRTVTLGTNGSAGDTLALAGGNAGLTIADLSAADQVAQVTGVANAALQTGLENIDLRGLAGNAQITGTAGANTLVGTAGNDTITAGGGADNIDVQGGFDTVVMTALGQTGAGISANGALSGVDVITGMGVGDRINLGALGVTAFNGATATEGSVYLSGTSGNVALIAGAYNTTTGVFTAGAGADLLFQYDANGTTAGGTEAIVLIGSNGAINSVSSDGAGMFTFG